MKILQINSHDVGGGAEICMQMLHRGYGEAKQESEILVGYKRGASSDVTEMDNLAGFAGGLVRALPLRGLRNRLRRSRTGARFLKLAGMVTHPPRLFDLLRGAEGFHYPGITRHMSHLAELPDIIQCHNLHNYYFDLRQLPAISQRVPTVLTLHDAWLTSGHCAHSLDCERWQSGCGQCPDLKRTYPILRDRSAKNWQDKREIFRRSRLYVATPSQWLMDKIRASLLMEGAVETRVIHNGVDHSVFRPADKTAARKALGLPVDRKIVLFVSNGLRSNPWKDFATLEEAIRMVGAEGNMPLLCLALGEVSETEHLGAAELRFIPPQPHGPKVAAYYQAADIFIHPTKADTFPSVTIEALSCGTPVVATRIGGIPEQIVPLELGPDNSENRHTATGCLVKQGNPRELAEILERLLKDDDLRLTMGANAAKDAGRRFSSERMVADYLRWFEQIRATNAITPSA